MRIHRVAVATLSAFVVALALVPAASAGVGRVVTLGDSLASGTNLGPRVPGSYAACGQTTKSYPQLTKELISPSTWADASCNGGHTGVMFYPWWGLDSYIIDPAERVQIPPQFNSLNGTEEAVILGTGGNEAFFGEVAFACLGYSPDQAEYFQSLQNHTNPNYYNNCTKTYVNTTTGANRLLEKVANSENLVRGALTEIKQRSPNAKIFLVGTPRIVPPNGVGCLPDPILTPVDAPIYAVWEDQLRLAMKRDATAAGAYYVDMHAAGGTTHTMCAPAANRWMNGWSTQGLQYPGLALHNTPLGAQEMAKAIAAAMKSAGMNVPDPTGPTGPPPLVAPDVARVNPVANPTNSPTQRIDYSGTPGNTFQCKLNNVAFACSNGTVELTNLQTRTHVFSVTQTTPAGAVSPAATVTWQVDRTPPPAPTVTRTSPTANPTKSQTQAITYSGEAGGTFQCKLDNVAYNCSGGSVALAGLDDRTHIFTVTQTDAVGNSGSATNVSWTVDLVAPLAPTVTRSNPAANPTSSTTQTISYAGVESGATVQCKRETGGAWVACPSSPIQLTGFVTGEHKYFARQTDAAGNLGPEGSVTWDVDATPPPAPTVTRTDPTANPSKFPTQTITYSGEAGGTFQCKQNTGNWTPCPSSPLTLTGLGNGTQTYSVTQTDALGNISGATTVTWDVDLVAPNAPTVSRTQPTDNPTNSPTQTINYSGEASGTFQCKRDSANYAACASSPVPLTGVTGGSHTYRVTQTDAAGNVSQPGEVSWDVDLTPPPAPSVSGPSGTTALSIASISYSNPESGVTFQCKRDSGAYAPCLASPMNLAGFATGPHEYAITSTDAVGNVSAPSIVSWTVDPNLFTVSITSGPNNPSKLPTASFDFVASITANVTYECKIDAASFAGCSSPKTYPSLPDGPHTFSVRATNTQSLQVTPITTRSWVIDTAPPGIPTLSRTSPTPNPTFSTTQTLAFAGAESGGVLNCSLDGASFTTCSSSPVTVSGLESGEHTYSVTQTDAAGNTGSAATVAWVVDPVPPAKPTVTRTEPSANPSKSASQVIAYVGAEPGGTFKCQLDAGSFGPCPASPLPLTGLSQGSHTYSVTQTDAAGNTGAPGSVTWDVDTIAPPAPTVARTNPTANPAPSASQTISYVGESGGSFQCKLDNAPYGACQSSPLTANNLPEGPHTYYVTQTDAAGNVSNAGSVTWTVDTIPPGKPTVSRTSPSANPTSSTSQGITYSGEAGGSFQCKLDGAAYGSCQSSPANVTGLFTGPHDYSVRQIDAAGNTGTETTVSWVVDYTVPAAPTVTRTQPATSPTNSPSQAISYSGEAGATFQCKLDSAPTGPCPASPVNLTGQLEGPHTYAVTQTDAAGNLSVAGSVTWTIDTTAPWAPTVTRTFPSETPTTSTSQTISYGGFEAGGSFACKLDDAEFGPCQASPITFTNLSDGQHTASFTHTDAAGNVSPPKPITWTVDVLAPEPPILTRVAPTINPTSSTSQTISYSGEPGGTYECKIDDAPFAACPSSPVTVTGLGLGSHTYTVRQTDGFGHVGSAGTIAWTVTNVPDPVVPTGATGSEGIVDPPITAKLSAVSPKAIVAARTGSPFFVGSKRSAASFTVTLSKAATVRLRLELLVSGKTSRASTAWTELKLKSGRTTIRLSGRSAKRALAAGRYRVHLKVAGTSTDVLGKTFQIKR